jgi:hypothetical protein
MDIELQYAARMRSHGIPSWPDPTADSQGRVPCRRGMGCRTPRTRTPPVLASDRRAGRLGASPGTTSSHVFGAGCEHHTHAARRAVLGR